MVAAVEDGTYDMVPDEALPGMSLLVSVVARRQMGPGTLLREISADIVQTLRAVS